MVEHAEMNQMVTAVIAALGSMENTAKVSFIEPVRLVMSRNVLSFHKAT